MSGFFLLAYLLGGFAEYWLRGHPISGYRIPSPCKDGKKRLQKLRSIVHPVPPKPDEKGGGGDDDREDGQRGKDGAGPAPST